jgi:hypothetical protein
MPLSNKEKQDRLRERRKKLGLKRYEFWLTPGQLKKVKEFIKGLS